jgi:phage terminase Nu1 subunit (DNA packaging protein)
MTDLLVDRRTLATVLNCSTRHLINLEAEGVIVPHAKGRAGRASTYDLRVCVPAFLAHVSRNGPSAKSEAKARRDLATAQLAELKLQKELRQLVAIDDVAHQGQVFAKAITAKLRTIPNRAVNVGILAREHAHELRGLIREVQGEIASWNLAAVEAAVKEDPDEDAA